METAASTNTWQQRLDGYFKSPVSTSVDELVSMREVAVALQRSTKKKIHAGQTGGAVSKVLGRGLDFAEVRSYQPGDDVRMIDWNVTARTGSAHTKLFVEERERPYFLVVDFRSSMRFGTQRMFKSVMAARLAAILGWCAVNNNDRVGGLVFPDGRHFEIKPQSGRRGLMALFRAIDRAQQQTPEPSSGDNLRQQFSRLRHIATTGSSVCILSDFKSFDAAAESALGPLLLHCDVLAVMINDPLERELPLPGRYALADANGRLSISTRNDKARKHYTHHQAQLRDSVENYFSRRRGQFLAVSTGTDISDVATGILYQTSLCA